MKRKKTRSFSPLPSLPCDTRKLTTGSSSSSDTSSERYSGDELRDLSLRNSSEQSLHFCALLTSEARLDACL